MQADGGVGKMVRVRQHGEGKQLKLPSKFCRDRSANIPGDNMREEEKKIRAKSNKQICDF